MLNVPAVDGWRLVPGKRTAEPGRGKWALPKLAFVEDADLIAAFTCGDLHGIPVLIHSDLCSTVNLLKKSENHRDTEKAFSDTLCSL